MSASGPDILAAYADRMRAHASAADTEAARRRHEGAALARARAAVWALWFVYFAALAAAVAAVALARGLDRRAKALWLAAIAAHAVYMYVTWANAANWFARRLPTLAKGVLNARGAAAPDARVT